jgi:hypothetical protein
MKVLLASAAIVLLAAACTEEPTQTRNVRATETEERAASETVNELDQAIAPSERITAEELAAGVPASSVEAPATTFSTAAVKTTEGESLGEVQSVDLGTGDEATAINVEVGGFLGIDERTVKIDADKFVYLPDRNVLIAAITKEEVAALPEQETRVE